MNVGYSARLALGLVLALASLASRAVHPLEEAMVSPAVLALKATAESDAPFESVAAMYELTRSYTFARNGVRRFEPEALAWAARFKESKKAQMQRMGAAHWQALCIQNPAYKTNNGQCLLMQPNTDRFVSDMALSSHFVAKARERVSSSDPVDSVAAMWYLAHHYGQARNMSRADHTQALYWLQRYETALEMQFKTLGKRKWEKLCREKPAHRNSRGYCTYTDKDNREVTSLAARRAEWEAHLPKVNAEIARARACAAGDCGGAPMSGAELRTVASYFETGLEVPSDEVEALRWYLAAAEAGDLPAMVRVGQLYEDGVGTTVDLVTAQQWLQRAGNAAGDHLARVSLKLESAGGTADPTAMYERAMVSVKRNRDFEPDAYNWLAKAAEGGHADAAWQLRNAHTYRYDNSVIDPVKARFWSARAAELGHPKGMMRTYLDTRNSSVPEEAALAQQYLRRAAEAGEGDAQLALGRSLQAQGNRDEALQWLRRARDGKDHYAAAQARDAVEEIENPVAYQRRMAQKAADEAAKAAAVAQANSPEALFIDHIHRFGPDTTDVGSFAYEVELYCRYGGPQCQAMRVRARNFQDQNNRAAERANMQRIWSQGSESLEDFGVRNRARSQCLQRLTESIQRQADGRQSWRYTGQCD